MSIYGHFVAIEHWSTYKLNELPSPLLTQNC